MDTTFNHYWSLCAPGPMRSPGQYKPSPPSLRSLLTHLFYSTLRGAHLSFCSSSMEERCSFPAHKPGKRPPYSSSNNLLAGLPGADCSNLRKAAMQEPAKELQHKSCIAQQNHETGATNQQDDFTGLQTAHQPFSPFHGRVTQLGLIIILGKAKTVY